MFFVFYNRGQKFYLGTKHFILLLRLHPACALDFILTVDHKLPRICLIGHSSSGRVQSLVKLASIFFCIFYVDQAVMESSLKRKVWVWGLNLGLVKSNTGLPTVLHRCDIFSKGVRLPAGAMTRRWVSLTCYSYASAQYSEFKENLIWSSSILPICTSTNFKDCHPLTVTLQVKLKLAISLARRWTPWNSSAWFSCSDRFAATV